MNAKRNTDATLRQQALEIWLSMGGPPYTMRHLSQRLEKKHGIYVAPNMLRVWRNRYDWDSKLSDIPVLPPAAELLTLRARKPATKRKPSALKLEKEAALMGTPVEELRDSGMVCLKRVKEYLNSGIAHGVETAIEAVAVGQLAIRLLDAAARHTDSKPERDATAALADPEEFKESAINLHSSALAALEARLIDVSVSPESATARRDEEEPLQKRLERLLAEEERNGATAP